jgi:hypothetical protein
VDVSSSELIQWQNFHEQPAKVRIPNGGKTTTKFAFSSAPKATLQELWIHETSGGVNTL